MKRINILTHRGLDPSKTEFFAESSFNAFREQLGCGFGLEFDANFTKDGNVVIFHDSGLERITNGKDQRLFEDVTLDEVKEIRLNEKGDRILDFEELMELLAKNDFPLSALHLKGEFQTREHLDVLLPLLKKFSGYLARLIIFDLKIETAELVKKAEPKLVLAPSVAHAYDIERYNGAVSKTLISIEEAIKNKDLFDWVWLDEWDRIGENNTDKKFYNAENFLALRNAGFKLALVTPELHSTSPGLLGGEAHSDAKDKETLRKRLEEIIHLGPDAVCTDYPDLVRQLVAAI